MSTSTKINKYLKRGTRSSDESLDFLASLSGGPLTFGRMLRAIRMGEEASQIEFAEKLGVSKQYLCDVEKERKTVSPGRAAEFARILDYSELQFVRLALQDQLHNAGLKMKVDVA